MSGGLALALAACASPAELGQSRVETLPFYDSADFTPRWLEPDEVPASFHRVPPFSLTDQRGEPVDAGTMDGKISVVDFFFASCSGICPKVRDSMRAVDEAFAPDEGVVLLSHSVTPDKDTVEVLAGYADRFRITSPKWHLLTGDREQIYALGKQTYFAEDDQGEVAKEVDFLHTESVFLVDHERRLRGVYNGLNTASVQQLIVDARTLLAERDRAQDGP